MRKRRMTLRLKRVPWNAKTLRCSRCGAEEPLGDDPPKWRLDICAECSSKRAPRGENKGGHDAHP